MTLMLPEIRHHAYEKFGANVLGQFLTATARTTTSISDPKVFNSAIDNIARFEHWRAVLPSLPKPDREKRLGRLSAAATCDITGAAWTETDTLDWELLPPDIDIDLDVNSAISEAQRDIYFAADRPATLWPNGTFDTTATAGFAPDTGVAADLTIEMSEDERHNETGFRSLLLTYNISGVYLKTALPYYATPGNRLAIYASLIPISGVSDSAPITFDVWDEDNNRRLPGTTQITMSTMVPQTIGGVYTVPAGCSGIGIRIGAGNGAIIAVDALPSHNITAEKRLSLPADCDRPFKLLGISTARYDYEVDATHAASRSRQMTGWNASSDYRPEGLRAESMTPRVAVLRALPERDIWFNTLRAWFTKCPLDSDAKGTQAPEELVLAASYLRIAKMLVVKRKTNPWAADMAEWQATVDAQFVADVPAADPGERSVLIPGGRAGRYSGG